jgi:two-component system, OmpR family, response regulator
MLLVEDSRLLVLDVLRDALVLAGFEVESAQTATEAVGRLIRREYAALVADCVLPDVPPLDWLAAARAAAPGTPLVLYSRNIAPDELKSLARQLRAAALLEKPFSPAQVVAAVRRAIG